MFGRYMVWIRKSPKTDWNDARYITGCDSFDKCISKAMIDMEGMPFEWMIIDRKTRKTHYGKVGRYQKTVLKQIASLQGC